MNQLVEESFVRPTATTRDGASYVPALDLSETQEGYLVEAALPGLKPEDLEITVENTIQ
jgi:HSP20 family protein